MQQSGGPADWHCHPFTVKSLPTVNRDRNGLFLLFFIQLDLYFLHQVIHSLLLLLPEKGCRDFPAQPSGVNLKEDQSVAHQPETSQQECDPLVRSRSCHIAERGPGFEGPLVVSVEVCELLCHTGLWDNAQSRGEPLNLQGQQIH